MSESIAAVSQLLHGILLCTTAIEVICLSCSLCLSACRCAPVLQVGFIVKKCHMSTFDGRGLPSPRLSQDKMRHTHASVIGVVPFSPRFHFVAVSWQRTAVGPKPNHMTCGAKLKAGAEQSCEPNQTKNLFLFVSYSTVADQHSTLVARRCNGCHPAGIRTFN